MKEKSNKLSIKIETDTKELDEAIGKTKELVSLLEKANELIQLLGSNTINNYVDCTNCKSI